MTTPKNIVSVYRNLHGGKAWNCHEWTVRKSTLNRHKSCGAKIAKVMPSQQLLLLNAKACYGAEEKGVRAGKGRAGFAGVRGEWIAPSAVSYRKGRRLGMRPDAGEFRFCYADTRELCPAQLPGVLFTGSGAYAVEVAR